MNTHRATWIVSNILIVLILLVTWNCGQSHKDIPGPMGPAGATGPQGPTGATGLTGETGSGIRTGFHVIEFGDPSDRSAPNTGLVTLNGIVLWDTTTTVPGSFTIFIAGEKSLDDVIKISGSGSKTNIGYYFQTIDSN